MLFLRLLFPCRPVPSRPFWVSHAGDARFDAFRKRVAESQASRLDWPTHLSVRKPSDTYGRERGVLECELEVAREPANRNSCDEALPKSPPY